MRCKKVNLLPRRCTIWELIIRRASWNSNFVFSHVDGREEREGLFEIIGTQMFALEVWLTLDTYM